MKPFVLMLLAAAALQVGCGDMNSEDCQTYCSAMNLTNAFGTWACYASDSTTDAGTCLRGIKQVTDSNSGQQVDCCYHSSINALAACKTGSSKHVVYNPPNLDTCLDQCEVNSAGDSMPSNLMSDIRTAETSGDYVDFLQAQLNLQCVVEASEK